MADDGAEGVAADDGALCVWEEGGGGWCGEGGEEEGCWGHVFVQDVVVGGWSAFSGAGEVSTDDALVVV